MTSKITFFVCSKLNDGKKEELIALLNELTEHCKKTEPGMLGYDWYLSEDEQHCYVIEQYADEQAVFFHQQNYQPFLPRLNDCRTLESAKVMGNVNDTLKAAMKGMGAEVCSVLGSL